MGELPAQVEPAPLQEKSEPLTADGAPVPAEKPERTTGKGGEATPPPVPLPEAPSKVPYSMQWIFGLCVLLVAILLRRDHAQLRGSHRVASSVSSEEGASERQDWEWLDWGRQGEAAAIRKRYAQVKAEFSALVAEKDKGGKAWHLQAKGRGDRRVWLKWPEEGGQAPWVIVEGSFDASADQLFHVMRTCNLPKMGPLIDPFFLSYKTVRTYDAQTELGRRATKRLLVYGPRDFVFGSYEERGRRQSALGVVSVPPHPSVPAVGGFTRAYQDVVILFTPLKARAKVTMVMRTDLRGAIPPWLFAATCGRTGLEVLQKMGELAKEAAV